MVRAVRKAAQRGAVLERKRGRAFSGTEAHVFLWHQWVGMGKEEVEGWSGSGAEGGRGGEGEGEGGVERGEEGGEDGVGEGLGGGEEGGVERWAGSQSASAITCAVSSAVIWAEGRS